MSDFPLTSIVITTYKEEAKKYLDLCVESINNLNYPKDKLDVVICARSGYLPQYEGIKTVCPPEMGFYTARGVNYGISQTNPDSKYILYANDDVIFTKNCLTNMIKTIGDNRVIVNAISPCDNSISYHLCFGYEKNGEFKQVTQRFNKYEDQKDDFKEMMDAESIYPTGIVRQPFLCIYATLIPRMAWEEVGQFDEKFKIGQDDLDWSYRALQKGWQLGSALDSLIWHFGGASNASTLTDELRRENVRYFHSKWGMYPPGMSKEDT